MLHLQADYAWSIWKNYGKVLINLITFEGRGFQQYRNSFCAQIRWRIKVDFFVVQADE